MPTNIILKRIKSQPNQLPQLWSSG